MNTTEQSNKLAVAKLNGKFFISVDYPFKGDANASLSAMKDVNPKVLETTFADCLVLAWNETFKRLAEQDPRVKVAEITDASELFF